MKTIIPEGENLLDSQVLSVQNPELTLSTSATNMFNAMRLFHASQNGYMPEAFLDQRFVLVDPRDSGKAITVGPDPEPMPLAHRMENIMMCVGATCILQHDELAKQTFNGNARMHHADPDVRNMCTLLYLVRCAFAHDPLTPRWLIKPKLQNKKIVIPTLRLELDTTGLHGKHNILECVGGWYGMLALIDHAQKLILRHRTDPV